MKPNATPMSATAPSHIKPRLRWRARLEAWTTRLPRCDVPVTLVPGPELEVVSAERGEYKAGRAGTRFVLDSGPLPLPSGWYCLETALAHNNGSRQAAVVASVMAISDVAAVEQTTPVVIDGQGRVSEVVWLPSHVAAISWVPTAGQGFFTLAPISLHRIGRLESGLRRLARVLDDLWRHRRLAPTLRCGLRWADAVWRLQRAYRCSAALHIGLGQAGDPDSGAADDAYRGFIALHDTVTRPQLAAMRKQAQAAPGAALSLMMAVRAPNHAHFAAALDAVIGQVYPLWELLLVGDFAADSQAGAIATVYQAKDARIRVVPPGVVPGQGEAAMLNRALAVASGDFAGVLDQHDLLPPHALFQMAQAVAADPGLALLYSDHDNLDGDGLRHGPHFKPDWNPDLFFSHDYLARLTLFRPEAALALGGYRSDYDGAASYDLLLRYQHGMPARVIGHVPQVLCHVRAPQLGTGQAAIQHDAGKRALADYLGAAALAIDDGARPGSYRVRRAPPARAPLVSIIIPTRDRVDLLRTCIDSLLHQTSYRNWELLVVDNQSAEAASLAYFAQLRSDPRIRVLRDDRPFNYSALNNLAVAHANGTVLALLNNDVEVIDADWLGEMVSHALRPEIGAVGAKLLYANGTVQHAGVILGIGWVAGHAHKSLPGDAPGYNQRAVLTQNMTAVTGACLVVRKSIYLEVGGLNEADLAVAFNDIDFCLKVTAAGYRNLFTPFARLYHHESISRGPDDTPEKRSQLQREYDYMCTTWGRRLRSDPAYSPNLTHQREDFSVRQHRLRT